MAVTDAQVRKLMDEIVKGGNLSFAAMKAGMSRKTARKYKNSGTLPSQHRTEPRAYRTRADPFADDWADMKVMLTDAPELEARTVFDFFNERALRVAGEEKYADGQLRTLQRRLKKWRASEGPPKTVFFPQEHTPGEAFQTDFTDANGLEITIEGVALRHKLGNTCLPYSNWQSVKVVMSESELAIRGTIQKACFTLGKVPTWHQMDNSSAATHWLGGDDGKSRAFNDKYRRIVEHFQMVPRSTGIGEKEQNGDVEASNGALKRRLKQHLMVRGNCDFASIGAYQAWVDTVIAGANRLRQKRLAVDLAAMRPLNVDRLLEFNVETPVVSKGSTIRIGRNTYSVPSRLIGEAVRVKIFEDHLEVHYGGVRQLVVDRLLGRNGSRINYRHIIDSLVRKPGAFKCYRHREDLFPTLTFRRAYDALSEHCATQWKTDMEYVRVLHRAARTMESEVEAALELLLEAGKAPLAEHVLELTIVESERPDVPDLVQQPVDLAEYDALIGGL